LRGKFPDSDREYQGVAIKLSHGVSVDGDTEVSVSSALEIPEDEHKDSDDDDSSDDGISISSETKRLMGNDPLKGVCLNKPERNKVMDLPLAIIGKESDGGASS
jgi:hypothetical protein